MTTPADLPSTAPVERSIDAGAIHLSIRDHAGGDPPLLALHGLASNARWWDLVAARLAPRHRVIAVDLRGHGLSDKPESGYSFEEVTADLTALVDALGLVRFAVAGHSWGASVALSVAAGLPEQVVACICVDGGASDLRHFFGDSWELAEERMRPPELRGVTAEMMQSWVANSPLVEGSDPETALRILLGNFEEDGEGGMRPRLRLERHMEIARHLYDLDSFTLMTRTRCPVLLLPAGSEEHVDDPRHAAVRRALETLDGRARVRWIEGHHDLPVQRPAEVAGAISEFLAAAPA